MKIDTYHPDNNKEDQELAQAKFKLIAEAYEVLSRPELREIYEDWGRDGLYHYQLQ